MSVVPGTVNLDPDGVHAYGSLAAPQADAEGAQGAAASPSRADKAYDDWNAGWNAAIAALAQQRVPDAVDLKQFRDAVVYWRANHRHPFEPINDEYMAEADRLLDLIDQQQEARGNGE